MYSRAVIRLLRPPKSCVRQSAYVVPAVRSQLHTSAATRQAVANSSAQVQLEDRKLRMTFTCTAPSCSGIRSTHEFSRQAYEKGIVLAQCPGCKTRHLVADHLGWFDGDDLTQGGKYKTIEDLLAAKGEEVKRGVAIYAAEGDAEPDKTVSFFPTER